MFYTLQLLNHLKDQHSDHWSVKVERYENYVLYLLQQYCFMNGYE